MLGLLTVLALPDASLPPELLTGLDRLLAGITALLAALKDQQARPPPTPVLTSTLRETMTKTLTVSCSDHDRVLSSS